MRHQFFPSASLRRVQLELHVLYGLLVIPDDAVLRGFIKGECVARLSGVGIRANQKRDALRLLNDRSALNCSRGHVAVAALAQVRSVVPEATSGVAQDVLQAVRRLAEGDLRTAGEHQDNVNW